MIWGPPIIFGNTHPPKAPSLRNRCDCNSSTAPDQKIDFATSSPIADHCDQKLLKKKIARGWFTLDLPPTQ